MDGAGAAYPAPAGRAHRLEPVGFSDLPGFADDDLVEAARVFRLSCAAIAASSPAVRAGLPPSPALVAVCQAALAVAAPRSRTEAAALFQRLFVPHRILTTGEGGASLLTGYYEPEVDGSLTPSADFTAPLLARPPDLVTLAQGETRPDVPAGLAAARLAADGTWSPYPDRAAIEDGALGEAAIPIVYVRDAIEAFLIHVQGSARVRLAQGGVMRVAYAGRNGQPYVSIGRLLVLQGSIALPDMSLAALKAWVRTAGQGKGEPGDLLMRANPSFIFFARDETLTADDGPRGAMGVPLTPLRSIAVDRALWSYGLPFWIAGDLPWADETPRPFSRLIIAQDTGSAITGAARADLFFGSGEAAGARAGAIRHPGRMWVLLPRETIP